MHGYPFVDSINVSVSNRTIPIRLSGSGVPLLLLHGYPLDSRLWDRLVPLLATDHLCIAPDLRGFGRSVEERMSFSIADLADDCCELLDGLQIRRSVVVCGLSMGGYVAMKLAELHATRVASLILTNTRANADDASGASNRRASASLALSHGVAKAVLPMSDKLLSVQTCSNQPKVVELVRTMMLETRASTIAWAQLAMADREDFRVKLRAWQMPVVCVAGAEDTIAPPGVMAEMSAGIPNSELNIVPNSAHLTPLECPEEFAQIVRNATTALR